MFKSLSSYRNSLILGALGILILVIGAILVPSGQQVPVPSKANSQLSSNTETQNGQVHQVSQLDFVSRTMAREIETALTAIEGAGEVKVAVFLDSGPIAKFASNNTKITKRTEEKDSGGGARVITEENDTNQIVTSRGVSGMDQPVVYNTEQAKVRGVLVVAQGARDSIVKANLHDAVKTLLDLQPHKIQVVAMKEGESR